MAERKGNIGARENKALAQTKGERTKMQNKAAFGSRIREYRIKKGLSQPQLAALLGVTKNAVTNWEAGASRPSRAYRRYAPIWGSQRTPFLTCPRSTAR